MHREDAACEQRDGSQLLLPSEVAVEEDMSCAEQLQKGPGDVPMGRLACIESSKHGGWSLRVLIAPGWWCLAGVSLVLDFVACLRVSWA